MRGAAAAPPASCLTVALLVLCASARAAKLLGLPVAGVRSKKRPVVGQQNVLDLLLGLLVDDCGKEEDGGKSGSISSSSHAAALMLPSHAHFWVYDTSALAMAWRIAYTWLECPPPFTRMRMSTPANRSRPSNNTGSIVCNGWERGERRSSIAEKLGDQTQNGAHAGGQRTFTRSTSGSSR